MRFCFILLVLFLGLISHGADVKPLIRQLIETREQLDGIPFSQVVEANTGKKLLSFDRNSVADQAFLQKISDSLERVMKAVSDKKHPAHEQKRINEVSKYFEETIREELNRVEGFECDFPKTAEGRTQRSGYPDLRLVDRKTGRIVYLDPKLFQASSRKSSLRTFYFTPQLETRKILDDAHHLLVGFPHEGKVDGVWKFTGWELVDLSKFHVRLKAEFQGSNRDLYQPGSVVGTSRP